MGKYALVVFNQEPKGKGIHSSALFSPLWVKIRETKHIKKLRWLFASSKCAWAINKLKKKKVFDLPVQKGRHCRN